MSLKDWVTLGRVHTSSLTQGAFLIGYFIGGGQLLSWETLGWMLFAIWFHYVGFLDNNIKDYQYDVKDSHKLAHPLVRGKITLEGAWFVRQLGLLLVAGVGVFITQIKPIPYGILVAAVGFGLLYNRRSKKSVISPLWITLSFAPLMLIPYFTLGGNQDILILLAFLYGAFQMLFQISVEGYLKDIDVDRRNLLLVLGGKFKQMSSTRGFFTTSNRVLIFAYLLLLVKLYAGLAILSHLEWPLLGIVGFLLCMIPASWLSLGFAGSQTFNNRLIVRRAATIEILSYFGLVFALQPVLGLSGLLFMIVYPLIWFVAWNRIYWSTWIAPRV